MQRSQHLRHRLALIGLSLLAGLGMLGAFNRGWAPAAAAAEPVDTRSAQGSGPPAVLRFRPGAPQLAAIQVKTVQRGALPAGNPMNGRVVYDENVTARLSAPVSGRITALRGDMGDHVKRHAALAEMDAPDLATAQADYDKALVDEIRKRATRDRTALLTGMQTASRKDLEAAEADVAAAEAESARAAQRLHNLGIGASASSTSVADSKTYGRYVLRTPIGGVIVDRQANAGMEVRPDLANPLYTVTDPDRLWVLADVPERDLALVKPGGHVQISTDAWPNEVFAGRIDVVAPAVDPVSRRVQARCSVINPGGRLKAEMYVRVTLQADPHASAIEVPNASLVLEGSEDWVIVQTAPGEFTRRRVHVGRSGRDSSFITEGLNDGDKVVIESALLLLTAFPPHAH